MWSSKKKAISKYDVLRQENLRSKKEERHK